MRLLLRCLSQRIILASSGSARWLAVSGAAIKIVKEWYYLDVLLQSGGQLSAWRTSISVCLRVDSYLKDPPDSHSIDKIWQMTNIDKWFLVKLKYIYEMEVLLGGYGVSTLTSDILRQAKQLGFSDRQLATCVGSTELTVCTLHKEQGIAPFVKQIDTIAVNFPHALTICTRPTMQWSTTFPSTITVSWFWGLECTTSVPPSSLTECPLQLRPIAPPYTQAQAHLRPVNTPLPFVLALLPPDPLVILPPLLELHHWFNCNLNIMEEIVPPPANPTDLLSALPIGRDLGASRTTPVLPPTPAAVLEPTLDPEMSLMAEMIILGVVWVLGPYFEWMIALLLNIQKDMANTRK
ncbi:hypothetical protein EDD85DRAFT_974325 [Armillaria nabsnona]|nr:hypothetical protein EDD85DRAFT_974325 [Armillaria nabsnona]